MPERADNSPKWILRRAVKAAAAGTFLVAGVHRAVRSFQRRRAGGTRVVVLSYHRATLDFEASTRESIASMFVSAQTMQRQIEELARSREIVSLADARRILAEPPGTRRRDAFVVTFDDGYGDNHHVAMPVLAALKVPATFFVATGYIGTRRRFPHDRLFASLTELSRRGIPIERAGLPGALQALLTACTEAGPAATLDRLIARLPHDRLTAIADALEARTGLAEQDLPDDTRAMTWDELAELRAAGMDVGGHTVNHAVLSNLPLPEARREIAGCHEMIAERLGPPRHFAYPNGYYTPAVRRAVAEAGFETGLTTEDRENARGGDPFAMSRKVLWENSTLGPVSYSAALAICNLDSVFHALGLAHPVSGERPDALPSAVEDEPKPSSAPGPRGSAAPGQKGSARERAAS
ncbi:polysaccharide deacetylase family protein [Anaeromyxobacter sp. Fw109-5]|uniref:polysaccharide deacetylase family protein n=1 Tax=Anaeromyxobacter sp. (strain Fw109-5) TaxID=404589 RepID=UPI0000ED75B7|nr:polysaccharide deacetylase family protein [Anaeromyxobacter sp. Fw109-5]ABS26810.1 polysaccharide deacetylase [Anaeromyxobacter sp. Fw109-5]